MGDRAAGAGNSRNLKLKTHTVELCRGIAPEFNGSIDFLGANPEGKGWENVFSTIFYFWGGGADFTRTYYYRGLTAYIRLVHNKENASSMGLVIYTNPFTLPFLQEHFPLESYPNLLYALPTWPYFNDETGQIQDHVLRTLRYHAVEHFPRAAVHIRDADSIFVAKYMEGQEAFNKIVENWETAYLTEFLPRLTDREQFYRKNVKVSRYSVYDIPIGKKEIKKEQIVIGGSMFYSGFYHRNLPYPTQFSFPMAIPENTYPHPVDPYKHLYTFSDSHSSENYMKIRQIEYDIQIAKNENIPEEFRKQEGNNRSNANARRRTYIDQEIAKYNASIPTRRRRIQPYMDRFSAKFMYPTNWAVFAGFVSVLQDKTGIEDFWKRCVEYLLSRSYSVEDPETKRTVTTNDLFKVFFKRASTGELAKKGEYGFGKDERMLLYAIIPTYASKIYFFNIPYYRDIEKYRGDETFFEPKFLQDILASTKSQLNQSNLREGYESRAKLYEEWLAKMREKYPTEEAYLDAVNANLAEKLAPFEEVLARSKNAVPIPFPNPYEEYAKAGRATVHRTPTKVGGRLTRKRSQRGPKKLKR